MDNNPAKEIREVGDATQAEVVYTFEFFGKVVDTNCHGLRTCLNAQQF
jgi:hypothetical protein